MDLNVSRISSFDNEARLPRSVVKGIGSRNGLHKRTLGNLDVQELAIFLVQAGNCYPLHEFRCINSRIKSSQTARLRSFPGFGGVESCYGLPRMGGLSTMLRSEIRWETNVAHSYHRDNWLVAAKRS